MSSIDFNQPLSETLRQSTKEAHDEIQYSVGATKLLSGELTKEEYSRFLMMLWHVYSTLEQALDRHSTNPVLEPIYNPALLQRAPALSISAISNSDDPSPLVAHAYVRYLGDLSGGQNIRHTLAKAYDLDEAAGEGVSFYAFKELASSKVASLGEMRRIKDWFRDGMDKGTEGNVSVKAAITQEASAVYYYNGNLFKAILDPTQQSSIPVTPKSQSGSGLVTSILGVITVVSLAHFALVLGGFSGPRGFAKLAAAEQWIGSFWGSTVQ
ncbi:heme oxygenase-like protein [Gymnopus androsaceus JB14]|uniref:heme oxygenase (biliverdin-producing) n=1 Tax=Gymnopus androsaceus JB14 TaxID=1447944 RepID=A0A6A4IE78_9AGAR|nr:heme oxygenase-like protein [Gymnopus androsaceus JB14]